MVNILMEVVAIAIFATIVFAVSSIYGRYMIIETENSYHFYLYQTYMSLAVILPLNVILLSFNLIKIDFVSLNNWIIIIISSIFAFFGFLTLFKGFEVGNVSVGGVFLSSRVLVSIPLAFFVFGEIYPTLTYIFILVSLIGALMTSYQKNMSFIRIITFRSSGSNWFIITLVFWAISNSLVRELNNEVNPLLFLLIRVILFSVFAFLTFPLFRSIFAKGKKMKINRRIIMHSFLYVLVLITAQASFIFALGHNLTIAEGLGILEGVFTFVFVMALARTKFFKNYLFEPIDKKTLIVRSTGVFLAFIGTAGALFQIIDLV